jgi:hypothetical protein
MEYYEPKQIDFSFLDKPGSAKVVTEDIHRDDTSPDGKGVVDSSYGDGGEVREGHADADPTDRVMHSHTPVKPIKAIFGPRIDVEDIWESYDPDSDLTLRIKIKDCAGDVDLLEKSNIKVRFHVALVPAPDRLQKVPPTPQTPGI